MIARIQCLALLLVAQVSCCPSTTFEANWRLEPTVPFSLIQGAQADLSLSVGDVLGSAYAVSSKSIIRDSDFLTSLVRPENTRGRVEARVSYVGLVRALPQEWNVDTRLNDQAVYLIEVVDLGFLALSAPEVREAHRVAMSGLQSFSFGEAIVVEAVSQRLLRIVPYYPLPASRSATPAQAIAVNGIVHERGPVLYRRLDQLRGLSVRK